MEELEETNPTNTTTTGGDGSRSKKTKKTKKTKSSTVDDNDAIDRITSLPESVLLKILSLVPTKDMVKLMLIPRLGNLWPNVHSLFFDFDYIQHYDEGEGLDGCDDDYLRGKALELDRVCGSFWNLVRNVLMLHECPTISTFHLKLYFDGLADDFRQNWMRNEIDACVRFAVKKKVEVFHLDLTFIFSIEIGDPTNPYKISSSVFRLSSLTELKLRFCKIELVGKVSLPSLKTLSLDEVSWVGKHMTEILDACPLLENLSLMQCYWVNELEITHSNMKTMTVHSYHGIKLYCPNLVSLSIIELSKIQEWGLLDISSLENVSISMEPSHSMCDEEFMIIFIEKLCHTKDIKLCGTSTKGLMRWNWPKLASPLFKWKSVELKLYIESWLLTGFSRFVASSPYLETLALDIYDAYSFCLWDDDGNNMIGKSGMAVENCWNSNDVSFGFCVHHLKTIMVSCFTTGPSVLLLLKLVLQNAPVLEKMVFTVQQQSGDKRLEICQQLLSFRRASTRAVIHFS